MRRIVTSAMFWHVIAIMIAITALAGLASNISILANVICAALLLGVALTGFICFDRRRFERSIAEKHYSVLESIPDGLFIVSEEWRFTHVNEHAERLLRKTAGDLVGTSVESVLDPLASELIPEMRIVRRRGIALERLQYFQSTNTWIEIRIQPAASETLVYLRDVTAQHESDARLRDSERRLRLLMHQVPAVLWTVDLDKRFTSVLGAGLSDQGLREEDLIGQRYERMLPGTDATNTVAELAEVFDGKPVRFETRRLGRWQQTHVEPLRDGDGEIVGAIGVGLDITDMKEGAEHLARLARIDAMTQLPNRLALEEELNARLERCIREKVSLGVLFVDLDRFKTINDTLGHRTGDDLLRAVAERLQCVVGERTTIFRPGGDEFIILVESVADRNGIGCIASALLAALAEPFVIDGRELFITASIGASLFPDNGRTSEELIKYSDSAMYRAKESGRNNAKFYDSTMHAQALERLGLEQDLRHALARDEFRLVYQPVIDVATRRIAGAEALIRWHHPRYGVVQPDAFIPIAEETGIIVDISRWILQHACEQAAYFRASGRSDFRVAVNLSPRDFFETDLPQTIASILARTRLPAAALDIEITENAMVNDQAVRLLGSIRAMGARVVVDDFGIGYSSLGYVKRLPVGAIKIDKSFLRDVTHNAYDEAIVKAIATLANTLDIGVIAEGIESEAQWEFIRALGCDQAQGFHFSRPLMPEELELVLAREPQPAPRRREDRVIPLVRKSQQA